MLRCLLIVAMVLSLSVVKASGDEDVVGIQLAQKLKIKVQKAGLIIGLQKGQYTAIELGSELQWKKIKLKKPLTIAGFFNIEYAWEKNVIGYKLGSWAKRGRADFTYGINTVVYSNFENSVFAISPSLGYKVFGFHFSTGYNLRLLGEKSLDYNKLYVSLRFFVSKRRNMKFDRDKKNKKKD